MHRLQEAIRLHRLGRSGRAISNQLRIGRNTLRAYITAVQAAGLLEGDPDELPEIDALRAVVSEHVPSSEPPQQKSSVESWRPQIVALWSKDIRPKAIHDYLRLHEPEYAGSLSAIKRMCARLDRERGPRPTDVAIPVVTAPGEVAQVDFAYAGKRYDPERGVMRKTWVFVMTLGFSVSVRAGRSVALAAA